MPGSPRIQRANLPLVVLLWCAVASNAGCGLFSSPTSPTPLWKTRVPAWSPYMVIQADDEALPGYQQALARLAAHTAIAGARIALHADGRSAPTVRLAASFGIEVVGIIDNADLFQSDVAAVFDQYASTYPQVRIFQVGNEVTASTSMSFDAYLDVLGRMYVHVRDRYPNVMLVSQATFGAGIEGAGQLAAMAPWVAAIGASPQRLIIGINVYTAKALSAYATALANNLTAYRIWVTETGIADPNEQAAYVNTTYPTLRIALRAERIYWYALWAGDAGGDSAFSLIQRPASAAIVPTPLFQLLTGGG
jgi:hypothetical protein